MNGGDLTMGFIRDTFLSKETIKIIESLQNIDFTDEDVKDVLAMVEGLNLEEGVVE